jgi:IPT/TIG domain
MKTCSRSIWLVILGLLLGATTVVAQDCPLTPLTATDTGTLVPPRKVSCGNLVKLKASPQSSNTPSPGGLCLPCFIRDSATWSSCDPTCCRSKATDAQGNRPAIEKVEIRGWITYIDGFEDDGDEYVFNVRLDLDWDPSACPSAGITSINSLDALSQAITPHNLARIGGGQIVSSNSKGFAYGGSESLVVKVEVNDWEGRSPSDWPGVPGAGVLDGWQPYDNSGQKGYKSGRHWIYDPLRPPGTPAGAVLKVNDYVRIVGTLWEDDPHTSDSSNAHDAQVCWDEGFNHTGISFDGHTFGRGWFEVHGVDYMAILWPAEAPKPPRPPETASTFSVLSLCGGARVTDWPIYAPGGTPPTPDAEVDSQIRYIPDFNAGDADPRLKVDNQTDRTGDTSGVRVSVGVPNFTDANGQQRNGKFMALFRVFWKIPPPTVTAVGPPTTIPFDTDAHIPITGIDFINVRSVFPASDFQVNSKTSITAHILSSVPAGCYDIGVRTDTGLSQVPNTVKFCVTPIVKDVSPASGPFTGGTQVTVTGAGFEIPSVDNPRGTSILVGGNDAGPVTCSGTTCTFTTPPGSPGPADVKACVRGACSATGAQFTYAGPAITSLTPSHGPITGGTWVEIAGMSLAHDGSIQIFFDDLQALQSEGCPPVFFSDTCIRVLSPPHGVGSVPITVKVASSSAPPLVGGMFAYDPHAALITIGYDRSRVTDQGWLELNGFAPAPDGASVLLTSSDPSAIVPPMTPVIVPAGSRTGNFVLTFPPALRNETVTVTASYGGSSAATSIDVRASPPPSPPPPVGVTIGADALARGDSVPVTVTLDAPAPPQGAVVGLSSSDPSAVPVPVPPTVTFTPGSTMEMFRITNNYSGRPKKVTITATYSGESASASLFVPTVPAPSGDCTHCATPEQCCVCNGGAWVGGRCE